MICLAIDTAGPVCAAAIARSTGHGGETATILARRQERIGRGHAERLRAVATAAGCHACHSQQGCALHCPKHLNPTASIAGLKAASFKAVFKGEL